MDNDLIEDIYLQYQENINTKRKINIIMLVGILGSGKSFIARYLTKFLNNHFNKVTVYLEQDMFYQTKKPSVSYEKEITKLIKEDDLDYLILSKSNHNQYVRDKTYNAIKNAKKLYQIHYINLIETQNIEIIKNICINRILKRGLSHRTLINKDKNEISKLLDNVFIKEYQPLTKDEIKKSTSNIILDITTDKIEMLKICVYKLINEKVIDEIEITDDRIMNIIDEINKEDNKISLNNKDNQKVLYDCIRIDNQIIQNILNQNKEIVDIIDKNDFMLKDEFHITLNYYGGLKETHQNIDNSFKKDINKNARLLGYYYNEYAVGLYVKLDVENTEDYHITLALKKDIKPVYLKDLLKDNILLKNIKYFKIEIYILGLTKRVYK